MNSNTDIMNMNRDLSFSRDANIFHKRIYDVYSNDYQSIKSQGHNDYYTRSGFYNKPNKRFVFLEEDLVSTRTKKELKNQHVCNDEKNEAIKSLKLAQVNANHMYYIGLITGIISGVGGIFYDNFLFVIVGISVVLTAFTGLLETKQNEW